MGRPVLRDMTNDPGPHGAPRKRKLMVDMGKERLMMMERGMASKEARTKLHGVGLAKPASSKETSSNAFFLRLLMETPAVQEASLRKMPQHRRTKKSRSRLSLVHGDERRRLAFEDISDDESLSAGLSPVYVAPSAHHGTSVVQGVPSTSSMDISASLHSQVHSTLNLSLDDPSMAELIPPERPALMNLPMNDEDERCDAVADAPPSRQGLLSSRAHPSPSCSISSVSSHAEMSDAPHMAPPRRAHATHKQAKPSPAVKAAPIGKPKIATKPRRQPPPAKRPPSPQRTKPKTTSSLPQRDRLSQAFLQRPSPPSPPRRTAATYRLDRNNLCCLQQLFLV